MRWLPLHLIAALFLLAMNRSFVIAEPLADVPRISDTTPLSPDPTDDAFVMPVITEATWEAPNSTHLVPPPPTENTTIIEQKTVAPHQLSEPDEVVRRSYNDSGWYSFPDWSRTTWRPRSGDRFGDFSLEARSVSPIESWKGLSFTHGYGLHFLSGPNQTDLPPRLFEYEMGLHWFGEVTNDVWLDLSIAGGVYTDFEDSARDGWRAPAHAVMSWEVKEEIQPVLGFQFYDRNNLGFLPVAGVILKPDEDLRLELVYPEPRLSWRTGKDDENEHWISVSGRIGGGEWAIERAVSGRADVVTYNDYELILGFETFKTNQSIAAIELGYTFERELKYRSNQGNYHPGETYFLRYSLRK